MTTIKQFEQFKIQFREICLRHCGTFSARDTIGNGAAYHMRTPWGTLSASICDDSGYSRKSNIQSIFLQWRDYSGPAEFPLHGDFNRFSHKWNITMSGGTIASVRKAALGELDWRLENVLTDSLSVTWNESAWKRHLKAGSPILITPADQYAALVSAVNRGDLTAAQQLAAQIAA